MAIVHEYGRQVEAWQMENDFELVSPKLRRLIKAYKYKYVLPWNTAVAQEVFRSTPFPSRQRKCLCPDRQ